LWVFFRTFFGHGPGAGGFSDPCRGLEQRGAPIAVHAVAGIENTDYRYQAGKAEIGYSDDLGQPLSFIAPLLWDRCAAVAAVRVFNVNALGVPDCDHSYSYIVVMRRDRFQARS
jgi:hypothetical protein